jgi:GrpB-like predicted nucleotidyltransferase (UPF0157 family)
VIEVVEYDPRWAEQFAALEARYREALAGVSVLAIEHVGSTAVPGLAAKPIIDVDIVVAAEDVVPALAAMERIGFVSRGERGVPDRWALDAPGDAPPTHTYVVVAGSLAMRNHLGVRHVLRNDAELRDAYGALKRSLAAEVDEIDVYVERKSDLLAVILERAGLDADERASITEINRA